MLGAPAMAKMNVETVVDGLNAPRGITLDADGSILVAEAGAGGDQCMGEGESAVCMGTTGTITRIVDGAATPVATGLLSAALSGGAEIVGPSDVAAAADGTLYVTMNLGADPADRAGMPPEAAGVAGWLVSVAPDGTVTPFSDVAAFEASDNPEPTLVDSNPYSVAVTDAGLVVADAGGNDLLAVDSSGVVSLVAAFPPFEALFPAEMLAAMGPPPEGEGGAAAEAAESGAPAQPAAESMAPAAESMAPAADPAESMAPAAPASGAPGGEMVPLPIESVPTSVVVGPDGAYYVGQLTGGPFPVGEASVLRVDPASGETTTYATGFTNIIDIAFGPDGTLYVAEIVHEGLMGVFTAGAAPIGALLSVPPGGGEPTILINDETFVAPGGITVDADGTIYASLNTLAPGAGSVVRITPES
jgi:sugar lactone lactonase YvrE